MHKHKHKHVATYQHRGWELCSVDWRVTPVIMHFSCYKAVCTHTGGAWRGFILHRITEVRVLCTLSWNRGRLLDWFFFAESQSSGSLPTPALIFHFHQLNLQTFTDMSLDLMDFKAYTDTLLQQLDWSPEHTYTDNASSTCKWHFSQKNTLKNEDFL